MEDSKRFLSPSSPNLSPSGNNENESENKRNSQRKNKHFMAPTFSTASKFTTPKKNILEELKPTNLDSKSSLHKMGTSNPTSTKSLLKNPSFSLSPKNNLMPFDETNTNNDNDDNEDETFVADCTIPYDPLTNYLSPRPKFLRYNPNRKRKILLSREDKSGNCEISPENSLDSESSCTPESFWKKEESVGNVHNLGEEEMEENRSGNCNGSSLKNGESEGNKKNLEEQDVEEEEEDDDEEMIEEGKWGFKRVLFKGLIVFFVLVFSTMYISSMNSPAFYPDSIRPTFEYENFGNRSFMSFSVSDSEFGLVFDGKDELEKGLCEINQLGVDGMIGGCVEAPGLEVREEIMGSSDCGLEETDMAISPQVALSEEEIFIRNFHDEIDYQENVRALFDYNPEREWYYGGFSEPMVESFKDVEEEIEAQMAVVFSNLKTEEESWVDFESKLEDGNLCDDIDEENIGGEDKMMDFDLKHKDVDPVNVVKAAVEGQFNGIVQKNKGDHESESIAETDDIQVRLTLKDFVWFVALAVMSFMACLVVKFYHKCKNLFSKTTSSKKKLNSEVKMVEINRSAGLPPKVGERFEKADSQVKLPRSLIVIESPEEGLKTPLRIIPNVKELGEIDFGTEFSSLKSSAVRSSKVEEIETRVFVVPDVRRTKRNKVSSSTPESHSYSSNITEEKTPTQEEVKEETSALRRSRRLRSRGVTSP